jgi:alpha-amylase
MTVFYELHNHENCDTYVHFVPEFNFGFCYAVDADTANMSHVHEWCRRDDGFDLEVVMQFSHAIDLWAFPVETVSLSEGGFERTYQGTSVAPILRTGISAGGTVAFKITLAVK